MRSFRSKSPSQSRFARQLSRRESPWHKDEVCKYCQGLPLWVIALHNRTGYILCALVWSIAILGILLKGLWITCPKWLSSVLYIGMGWLCVLAFVPIFHSLPRAGFGWLLAGGIIYTIGGVIYSLKLPLFNARHKNFGSHEIFHVFIMLGSACHFIVMYCFISTLPV